MTENSREYRSEHDAGVYRRIGRGWLTWFYERRALLREIEIHHDQFPVPHINLVNSHGPFISALSAAILLKRRSFLPSPNLEKPVRRGEPFSHFGKIQGFLNLVCSVCGCACLDVDGVFVGECLQISAPEIDTETTLRSFYPLLSDLARDISGAKILQS